MSETVRRPTPLDWQRFDWPPPFRSTARSAETAIAATLSGGCGEETHLWFTDLDQQVQDGTVDFLLTLLDDQERARALRFRRSQLTNRFVMAHGRLRQILAAYLGQAPEQVEFCYGDRGKPGLAGVSSQLGLQFNLSHSDRYALIAVGHHPLGVDLEKLQPFPSASSLAKRFFSAKEFKSLQLLNDLPPLEGAIPGTESLAKSRAFLRYWVCKEAYVKATGEGLVDQLDQVVVGLEPQAHFVSLPAGKDNWQVLEFAPSPDTLAALVLPRAVPLRCRCWQMV